LNQTSADESRVLVAGNNFGCGSSREHAPWGLVDFGFRAVVSTQIADIFRNNALKNGLVPIIVDAETHKWLLQNPGAEVTVDVGAATLTLPDGRVLDFPIDGFSQHCLLEGIDELGYLLSKDDAITAFEQDRA
jgi:3-isopropylmalate/(R)-2-methylmalate dehydratase small subunit